MGQRIKKLKKIRLHREGTDQLVYGMIAIVAIAAILWSTIDNKIPFWIFVVVFGTVYGIVLNFYRCPIRYLNIEDTDNLVVAPADGKIVVIEEVDNAPYFNDRRLMISIFMSLWNVHANWFPVDGKVKFVKHVDGNYHKAWLPKASEENEHADTMITTPKGVDVLCRQIAGAVARRTVYGIVLNFYRCPIRYLNIEDTDNLVVAPADGKIVVIEEVDNAPYFNDRRLMISIFMSLWNVHANWFPVDGKVKFVKHVDGNYHKAWLPKASEENEHADTMITTPKGVDVLCRQIAGAVARRIVTYAKEGEECYIDEHLGFIKLGSRVDVYLPLGSEVCVKMGQSTTGDQTIIAKLK